ncbi:MAG: FUSC family protein, partial [Candidatus Acidiferrum sp.]
MGMSLERADWKNALLTGVATCLCYWIAQAMGLKAAYWAAITCIVVCQSEVGATLLASRNRLIGTAIGAVIGWGAVLVWHEHIAVFGVAIVLTIALCNVLGLETAGRLAGVTVAIVVLLKLKGPAWEAAGSRFIEVALGVVVA